MFIIGYFLIFSFIYPAYYRTFGGRAVYGIVYCLDKETLKQQLYVQFDEGAGRVDIDPDHRRRIVKAMSNEIIDFFNSKPWHEWEGFYSDEVFYVIDLAILDANNVYGDGIDNFVLIRIYNTGVSVSYDTAEWFREVYFKEINSHDVYALAGIIYEVNDVSYKIIKPSPPVKSYIRTRY